MSVVSNLLVPIENQRPEKTLRFLLLSESRRTLPHPHNGLVVGSSPTGPTIFAFVFDLRGRLRSAWEAPLDIH